MTIPNEGNYKLTLHLFNQHFIILYFFLEFVCLDYNNTKINILNFGIFV